MVQLESVGPGVNVRANLEFGASFSVKTNKKTYIKLGQLLWDYVVIVVPVHSCIDVNAEVYRGTRSALKRFLFGELVGDYEKIHLGKSCAVRKGEFSVFTANREDEALVSLELVPQDPQEEAKAFVVITNDLDTAKEIIDEIKKAASKK